MQYRTFGRTGLRVSVLGFGCGRAGGLLLTGSREDRRLAVDRAIAGGVNWFDTAEAYGTENALGELLADIPHQPFVSTKVTVDPASRDLAGQVEERAQACLQRLRRPQVTLMQVHNRIDDGGGGNALTAAQVLAPGGVAEGLERLKARGAALHIGFTGLGDIATILEVIDSGRFDSVQVYYNLVNPSAARPMPANWSGQSLAGLIAAARAQNMGMLGIRVLDGGIIASDVRPHPVAMMVKNTSEAEEQRRGGMALRALGPGLGTRPQVGLRFALACPDLSLALVGMGEPGHVDEALAAVAAGPLPEDALARLEPLYQSGFA
jgi:aryl-alcohol dehydrogenase-like predicted oxidoreductase